MSEIRKQFTFYRSYWEAIRGMGKRDRLAVLEAVILYALENVLPSGLSSVQQAMFTLIQPTLDASRRKALSGRQGGSKPKANSKQIESKWEANCKQTESEIENEKDIENDIKRELEWEKEKDKRSSGSASDSDEEELFNLFWEAYPSKIGKQAAWESWAVLCPDAGTVERIMESLNGWKTSRQWLQERGRYIPRAAKWLSEGHWMAPPESGKDQGEGPRQLDADEQAAIRRMMEETYAGAI